MANDLRICIQNLSAYNDGRLINAWLDFPIAYEDLDAAKANLLARGGGEEIMIADSEGFPFSVGEYDNLDKLNEWAAALENEDVDLVRGYMENLGLGVSDDPRDTIRDANDAFVGEFRSDEDFAEEIFGEVHAIPEHLAPYIDWERVARDLMMDGFWKHENYYYRDI